VVYGNASFCHHLFQIAVAERIPQIPSNAQNDDLVFEVSPSEKGRPGLSHSLHPSRPASTSLQQIPFSCRLVHSPSLDAELHKIRRQGHMTSAQLRRARLNSPCL
jgi:hypothetical protein